MCKECIHKFGLLKAQVGGDTGGRRRLGRDGKLRRKRGRGGRGGAGSFAQCEGQEMCILDSFFAISRVFKLLAGDLVQHIAQSLLDDIEGDLVTLGPA